MKYTNIRDAHKFSSHHKKELMEAGTGSCFYCLETFDAAEVTEWWDNEDTAVCPNCRIDSVLPGPVDREFLNQMMIYWFAESSHI